MYGTEVLIGVFLGLMILVCLRPFFPAITTVLLSAAFALSGACVGLGIYWIVVGSDPDEISRRPYFGRNEAKEFLGVLLTGAGVIGLSVLAGAVWLRDGLARQAPGTASPPPVVPRDEPV